MTSDQIYAALLRLYSKPFRDEYGKEMAAAFRAMRDAHRGHVLTFWGFVLADLLVSAAYERFETMQWLATSVIGLLVTVGTAHAVTWTFRYFYHPYFEDVSIPALPFGVGLGFVLGGTVGVAQWLLIPATVRRASRWALASAVALPLAILFCSAALDRAMTGLDPIAQPHPAALDLFVLGLARPSSWADLATQFSAMAASALLVRALMLKPLMERSHAH